MIKQVIYKSISILCLVLLVLSKAEAQHKPRFKAVAFDYFVLFDPNSVIPAVEKYYNGRGTEITKMWRSKQFEYCFLRSITHKHLDFYKVTEDALVYTAKALKIEMPAETQKELVQAYLSLKLWPDSKALLEKLKSSGIRVITIANFSRQMLRANADGAGITNLFEDLLSTEDNKTYKPDPGAYELGMKKLKLKKEDILFVAFGGWDAYGAKTFGYTTYWVNRFNMPLEELGYTPDQTSTNLDGLADYILGM